MRVPGDVSPKEPRAGVSGVPSHRYTRRQQRVRLTVNDHILQGWVWGALTLSRAQDLAIHPVFPHHERVMAIVVHIPLGLRHSGITKTCERLGSVLQRSSAGALLGVSHIVLGSSQPSSPWAYQREQTGGDR